VLVVCAVVALAVAGAALGFTVLTGPKLITLPTTGPYQPLTWPRPLNCAHDFIPNPLKPCRIDPDSTSRGGSDVLTTLTVLGGDRYRLRVTNTSGNGHINNLHWFPPKGIEIKAVTGSSVGECDLTGTKGAGGALFPGALLNPEIRCLGVDLKPPTCTCRGDGGFVDISFTLAKDSPRGLVGGIVRIDTLTPVLKVIPSFVQRDDLRYCTKAEAKAKELRPNATACVTRP
jgi:hypothetical protein